MITAVSVLEQSLEDCILDKPQHDLFGNFRPQYNLQFRPVAWWLKFQTADDREKAKKVKNPRWVGELGKHLRMAGLLSAVRMDNGALCYDQYCVLIEIMFSFQYQGGSFMGAILLCDWPPGWTTSNV